VTLNESSAVSAWGNALVHLVWWRCGQTRSLVFGWIELLPTGVPIPANHPFLRRPVSESRDRFFHAARFPMTASEATTWFARALAGELCLPGHPDKPTPGDDSSLADPPTAMEPPGDDWSTATDLPFLPKMHGVIEVRGLHGKLSAEVLADVDTSDFEEWFRRTMFFNLGEHTELRGSLLCVRHNPIIRRVEVRLEDRTVADETELYRVISWPKAKLDGCRLVVSQRRPHGISKPVTSPLGRPGEVISVQWFGKVNETAAEVVGEDFTVQWRSDFTGFFRQIGITASPVTPTEIVEIRDKDKIIDTFSVAHRDGPLTRTTVIGEALATDAFQVTAEVARLKRLEKANLLRYTPMWLEEEDQAANVVRSIVAQAKASVWLFDPYFSRLGLLRFVMAVPRSQAEVSVFTSAEMLNSKISGEPGHRAHEGVERAIEEISQRGVKVKVFVLPGGGHPMHDRFIVVDQLRAWMSGNSLEAIGRRASVLLELPNADELIENLARVKNQSVSFSDWLALKKTGKEGPGDSNATDDEPLQ
jgi:hypothetical protein